VAASESIPAGNNFHTILHFLREGQKGKQVDPAVTNDELRCEEVEMLSDRFVDNELPSTARLWVWRHIRDCIDCELLIEGKAALKRLIQSSARSVLVPSSLRQHLRALIRT